MPRAKLLERIANLPRCLTGMEACSGAHHWARAFAQFGKNDAADAVAIAGKLPRLSLRSNKLHKK